MKKIRTKESVREGEREVKRWKIDLPQKVNTSSHSVVSRSWKLNLFVGTKTETQITSIRSVVSVCVCVLLCSGTSIYLASKLCHEKKNKSFLHQVCENALHNVFVGFLPLKFILEKKIIPKNLSE